jgi:hypothetical protein
MYNGTHLWGNDADIDEIVNIKKSLFAIDINNERTYNSIIPKVLVEMFLYIKTLNFHDEPNYDYIISIIKNVIDNLDNKYGRDNNVDLLNQLLY